jgi:probable rRNA maturation factor
VLLCDDAAISDLNRRFGDGSGPTDVLSFEQAGLAETPQRVLGDVVISLETAERNAGRDPKQLRREVDLLFCHGLLHLLGYDHATERDRTRMQQRQAAYLDLPADAAWEFGKKPHAARSGG